MKSIINKKSLIIIFAISFFLSLISAGIIRRIRENRTVETEQEYTATNQETNPQENSSPRDVAYIVFAYFPFWIITVSLVYITFDSRKQKDKDPRRA